MAMVDVSKMKREDKERNAIHDSVDATYTVFEKNGGRYFQIDTYGRSSRDIPGKLSQTIQFDKKSALKLIELLAKAFSDD